MIKKGEEAVMGYLKHFPGETEKMY